MTNNACVQQHLSGGGKKSFKTKFVWMCFPKGGDHKLNFQGNIVTPCGFFIVPFDTKTCIGGALLISTGNIVCKSFNNHNTVQQSHFLVFFFFYIEKQ